MCPSLDGAVAMKIDSCAIEWLGAGRIELELNEIGKYSTVQKIGDRMIEECSTSTTGAMKTTVNQGHNTRSGR